MKSNKKDDSIKHQLQMNREFIAKNITDGILAGEYYDDGVSGTTFNRPGFAELLQDIKRGKINAVIVKDFSRFGRNYLEALELLEVVFPELDVRFISIDDAYDSADPRCSKERLVYIIKHLANEYYARVVSKKLTQAHELNRGRGEFWGARPPYGFERSEKNRKILIIDRDAAKIVIEIFNMFVLKEYTYFKIAKLLNEESVPCPAAYYLIKHGKEEKVLKNPEKYLWTRNTVSRIIQNPVYIGCLVTHKTEQSYYKNHKIKRVPREEWNIEDDVLPRIIGQTIYDEAQKRAKQAWLNNFNRENDKKLGLFSGKIICGICGRHMSQNRYKTKKGLGFEYHCPGHDAAPGQCKTKFINEKDILKAVTVLLDKWVCVAIKEKKANRKNTFISKLRKEYQKHLMNVDIELQSITLKQQQLYEDYIGGLLDKREYVQIKKQNSDRIAKLVEEKGKLQMELNDAINKYSMKNKWLSALLDNRGELCITAEIINELIKEIRVVDKTSIEVHFKFEDIFNIDLEAEAV
ncbi:TPA: recombinase family protein [Clostridioides difficile]|nr:recombinase [Clostridioides difficile]ELX4576130.1 recombinase family protein [Clostridioides difficile]MBH7139353.1 recombinase family protein [Clostridioides difficile]MBY1993310.1 recombinase family protein [Clostridioides difficile]MBY2144989.1 recombinase family protein [Clostridioides difficile]